MQGLESLKTVFDVRTGSPKSLVSSLKLIHQTFRDENIRRVADKPSFVVVFMGSAVKHVSKDREGMPPKKQKLLDEIAGIVSEMSKDGIGFEICLFAARAFGTDPASILPEIQRVENGWISSIRYQTKGYSLIPVF